MENLKVNKPYTTGKAAKICGVSQQTIIRGFDKGIIPGHRVPGSKSRRIPSLDLYEYMKKENIPLDNFPEEDLPESDINLVNERDYLNTITYKLESKSDISIDVLKEGPASTIEDSVHINGLVGAKNLLRQLDKCREQLGKRKYKLLPQLVTTFSSSTMKYVEDYINTKIPTPDYFKLKDILVLSVCSEDAFGVKHIQDPKNRETWDEQVNGIYKEIIKSLKDLSVE